MHYIFVQRQRNPDLFIGPYETEDEAVCAMENSSLINGIAEEDCLDMFVESTTQEVFDQFQSREDDVCILVDRNNPDFFGHVEEEPEKVAVHFDLLRDRRVTKREHFVIGHRYLLCHVPMDNPYTHGVDPHCSEKVIIDIDLLSHNDIYTKGTEHHFKDKAALSRLLSNPELNRKNWMFRTQEEPFLDGREWVNWHYFPDDQYQAVNYILDLDVLEEEGIEVLRTTSMPYVISPQLAEEREQERQLELEYLYDTERDADDEQENFTDALEDREPEL